MSKPKHTPGPWIVKRRFDVYEDTGQPGVGGTYIGSTRGNGPLPPSIELVDEANARLMAAAPELLEACRATIAFLEVYSDEDANVLWGKVTAAIRKATGSTV